MEVIGAIAAAVAIITPGVKSGQWLLTKLRARKQRKAEAKRALDAGGPPYPVRLTCTEETEFHPSSGYREGLVFEVFNHAQHPVTVNGFGLDITLQAQDEWHEHELARHFPPYKFPVRLQPHDGLEGVIDTEALTDDMYTRGVSDYVVGWRAYVEVVGYGRKYIEI